MEMRLPLLNISEKKPKRKNNSGKNPLRSYHDHQRLLPSSPKAPRYSPHQFPLPCRKIKWVDIAFSVQDHNSSSSIGRLFFPVNVFSYDFI